MPINTRAEIRVRFAPSPTGMMHLGNVRAALINYLFARQKNGKFILRIEDTDPERNVDPYGQKLIADLSWLGLNYDEGPNINGPYGPYIQSERTAIYQQYLKELQEKNYIYRCFCTVEELEKKRQRQIALKQPPRYDRTCLKLSSAEIEQNLKTGLSYIWRFKLPDTIVEIHDLAHGTIIFDLKNFSDFALTRNDGSFTFMFANFVDDMTMRISHVFRGEDHLSNTAGQVALYQAFNAPIPVFWHLPIIVNTEGKKLSKRDFGFSLNDLREAGFLPEALCNYLAIIGSSFSQEILSISELILESNFDSISSTGQIKYDLEKLRWVNHHWIMKSDASIIAELCKPFLESAYPEVNDLAPEKLASLIKVVKDELITLADSIAALEFYFKKPVIDNKLLDSLDLSQYRDTLRKLVKENINFTDSQQLLSSLQIASTTAGIPAKKFFVLLRIVLTGKAEGLGVKDLFSLLDKRELKLRLETF